jgi:hypothetical protein
LANTEEIQDGNSNGTLGEVFIRCVLTFAFGLEISSNMQV